MTRRPPRWLRELVEECSLAATHAQLGGGLDAVARLESRVSACATEHKWELGDLIRELMRLTPGENARA